MALGLGCGPIPFILCRRRTLVLVTTGSKGLEKCLVQSGDPRGRLGQWLGVSHSPGDSGAPEVCVPLLYLEKLYQPVVSGKWFFKKNSNASNTVL